MLLLLLPLLPALLLPLLPTMTGPKVFITLSIALLSGPAYCHGELQLVDNGYEGLLVSISDHVPVEHCNHVVNGLKSVLREFSSLLWSLTDARASVRDVTVILPSSWKTDESTCSLVSPMITSTPPGDAHIQVTSSHPVFGNRPWVHQTQGCGRQGDYIQIGDSLIRSIVNDTYSYTARLLVGEWVKFRWGTFEEQGFPEDPLYPKSYLDPVTRLTKSNTCTNYQNPVMPICPSDLHNPEAPTKHNSQCGGRSAWDIILQSQDFANGRNSPSTSVSSYVPTMNYVQETAPRMVLLVEDTAVMNLQQRWEFMRKAIRRVMVYDVPDGVQVAIVIFNSEAKTTAPLMKMESLSDVRQRVGSSLPRNPSTVPESQKNILFGLREAIKVLTTDSGDPAGAKVIMVTTGNSMAPQQDVNEMLRLATVNNIRVDTIIYPQTEHRVLISASHGLESLVAATKGSSFTVMDEGVGKDSKLNMMVSLMDALFSSMCSSSAVSSGVPVLIHSKSYPGGLQTMSDGSFTLDDSFGPLARFLVFYYDLNHVGNSLQLISPSGEVIDAINMQEDGDANVVFVTIPEAERGLWQYKLENRADSHQSLHVQVTGTESNVRKVRLKVWTNGPHAIVNMTDPSIPVIVYAEVKDGNIPILNAKVTARLKRLGNDVSGSSYNSIPFDLYDSGFGDPDITADDGVYSRYIPTMYGGAGYYQLTVTADDNNGYAQSPVNNAFMHHRRADQEVKCCGSRIRYEHTKRVAPFQRSVVYGVLDVLSINPGNDIVPPNRILDLQAQVNATSQEVTLQWTSPGDDYDWGQAQRYEVVLAESWPEAKAFEGHFIGSMPNPAQVGIKQKVTTEIDVYESTLYIAIRAVDEAGNRGGVSNIPNIWVPRPVTTPPIVVTPEILEPIQKQAVPFEQEIVETVSEEGLTMQDFIVILSSTGGFLVFMIIVATFCYCFVARHKFHHDKDSTESNPNILIKTNSTLEIDQDEGSNSPDSTLKDDVIASKGTQQNSPIQEQKLSITGELLMEGATHSKSIQSPFPDVTLTSTNFCSSSEPPSTTSSHNTPYQTAYTIGTCSSYPYPLQVAYPNEDMAAYIPASLPSHSSQASMPYTQEDLSKPYGFAYVSDPTVYQVDPSYAKGQIPDYPLPPPVYESYPCMPPVTSYSNQPPGLVKVPPPVAPKPTPTTRASTVVPSEVFADAKGCHATHV
ncbi:calcium-activated chloride channel regulator 2-like [Macrobrachium nipponense]|uniref:calcium-activated chloride channel regulator 2-like n=1 Tax=Macrobrachium nipponense TaxID=159736 RepID=UPI0030C8C896